MTAFEWALECSLRRKTPEEGRLTEEEFFKIYNLSKVNFEEAKKEFAKLTQRQQANYMHMKCGYHSDLREQGKLKD